MGGEVSGVKAKQSAKNPAQKARSTRRGQQPGVGPAKLRAIIKELRRRYGPMLKRLAG